MKDWSSADNKLDYGESPRSHHYLGSRKSYEELERDYRVLQKKYDKSLAESRWRVAIISAVRDRGNTAELLLLIRNLLVEEFGFDRVGVFSYDSATESMHGAWGTDLQGRLEDISSSVFPVSESERQRWQSMHSQGKGYWIPQKAQSENAAEFRDHAVVFLSTSRHLVGYICIDNLLTGRRITADQLEAVVPFAEHAAMALFNARMRADREAMICQQRRVMEIVVSIAENKGVDDGFRMIRNAILELGFVDRAGIWLIDGDTVRGTWGTDDLGREIDEHRDSFSLSSQSKYYHACKEGDAPFVIGTLDTVELGTGEVRQGVPHALIPLRSGSELVGVITVDTLLTMRKIAPEHLELILLLAKLAAVIVAKRRLLEDAQLEIERRTEVEALLIGQTYELTVARDEALDGARVKSEFLANMSHEIRTPMNGVIGLASLLLNTPLSTDQRKYAVGVKKSAAALLTVINDILDLSRLDAGKLTIAQEPFDLRQSILDVVEMIDSQKTNDLVSLTCCVPPELPELLIGDEDRVRQMLTNLAANAVKFTDEGEVAIRALCLDESPGELKVRIEVRDTGIGIADDRMSIVFDSFTQADGSSRRRRDGTGLGLTITKQIVELMGGEICLESELGKGTTAWLDITFPKPMPSAEAPGTFDHVMKEPLDLCILLAEDNPVNALVVVARLELWGCKVVVVESGSKVLEAVASQPFDLVLMDISMPDVDGILATQELRKMEQQTGGRLPVIALTAHAMGGDRERFLAAGMDDYISKPVDFDALWHKLRHHTL